VLKVVIFDFDGVILDSMPIKTNAFRRLVEDFGSDAADAFAAYHKANGGLSRYVKIRYFFEEIVKKPVSDETVLEYADKFSKIVTEELSKPDYLIKETMDFIASLHGKKKLFIASGADDRELKYLCAVYGIERFFDGIYGSPTPKELLVAKILQESSCGSGEAVLIGDSINDYYAADSNKVCFLGYNNDELRRVGGYIDSFAGLELD
jgi:phosphoglycolate phosphatase-like HAD superfamily hydrolase